MNLKIWLKIFLLINFYFFDYIFTRSYVNISHKTFEMRSKSARLPAKINIPRSLFSILKVHNFIKTKSVLDKILSTYCIKLRGVSFGLIYGHEYKIKIFSSAVNQGYSIYSITKFSWRIQLCTRVCTPVLKIGTWAKRDVPFCRKKGPASCHLGVPKYGPK